MDGVFRLPDGLVFRFWEGCLRADCFKGSLKPCNKWRILHGVQGQAPARGRRRNACAGKRQAMSSLKPFHLPPFQAASSIIHPHCHPHPRRHAPSLPIQPPRRHRPNARPHPTSRAVGKPLCRRRNRHPKPRHAPLHQPIPRPRNRHRRQPPFQPARRLGVAVDARSHARYSRA